jgi:hypothetical protein
MTFRITTLSKMTLSTAIKNKTQHNGALYLVMLCLVSQIIPHYGECRYGECHYAECRGAHIRNTL